MIGNHVDYLLLEDKEGGNLVLKKYMVRYAQVYHGE